MKNISIAVAVILVVVFAGAGFFAGMQYQKSQRPAAGQFAARFGGGQGSGRFGGQNSNTMAVRGQIISSDSSSITVKLPDGSSKIVLLSGSPSITEATSAGTQALQSGKEVMVFGTTNQDGSVTASNVQINPQAPQFGGNGRGRGGASSSSGG